VTPSMQLDLFASPPPILGGVLPVRVRRPMRLAPDVVSCPDCGAGSYCTVMEQDGTINEVATYCSRCGHLTARTPRLLAHAVALLDTFGDAACCLGPTLPVPLPIDRPPLACAWNGTRAGCACRRPRRLVGPEVA